MLLWLWHRPAAVDPIQPLAWELPSAVGTALKKKATTTKSRLVITPGWGWESEG